MVREYEWTLSLCILLQQYMKNPQPLLFMAEPVTQQQPLLLLSVRSLQAPKKLPIHLGTPSSPLLTPRPYFTQTPRNEFPVCLPWSPILVTRCDSLCLSRGNGRPLSTTSGDSQWLHPKSIVFTSAHIDASECGYIMATPASLSSTCRPASRAITMERRF